MCGQRLAKKLFARRVPPGTWPTNPAIFMVLSANNKIAAAFVGSISEVSCVVSVEFIVKLDKLVGP